MVAEPTDRDRTAARALLEGLNALDADHIEAAIPTLARVLALTREEGRQEGLAQRDAPKTAND